MKKGEKRKQELLQIAYRLFLSRGYEETSVDEIIEKAGIAKGTFYYYFSSKEQLLGEVIDMMIEAQAARASKILEEDMSVYQKVVGIISCFRLSRDEQTIEDTLNAPENVLMHEKTNKKIIETIVPIMSAAVEEGVEKGAFSCDDIPERVRIIMIVSSRLFDELTYTERDGRVFIDMVEKLLGAGEGTMEFIKGYISKREG